MAGASRRTFKISYATRYFLRGEANITFCKKCLGSVVSVVHDTTSKKYLFDPLSGPQIPHKSDMG